MLHDIVQAAMGWKDYHLWEIEAGDRRYGPPHPEWSDDELADARDVKLGALIERGVRELIYTYDMGDNWEHGITVEAVRPGDPGTKYPRFIEGGRRCPPEDIGGLPGYENFLEAIAEPSHADHDDARKYYGAYDREDMDEPITERRVAAIAIRRSAAKAGSAKRRT